jgi:hypothetical protein
VNFPRDKLLSDSYDYGGIKELATSMGSSWKGKIASQNED